MNAGRVSILFRTCVKTALEEHPLAYLLQPVLASVLCQVCSSVCFSPAPLMKGCAGVLGRGKLFLIWKLENQLVSSASFKCDFRGFTLASECKHCLWQ